MGWTDRFRRRPAMESRAEWGSSAIPLPNEGNANTYANVDLRRADASMQKVAVWAAVMLLSRLVGSLPLDTYRRRGDGPPVNIGNSRFIEDPAGDDHGLSDWLAQYMTSNLLRGNVYGKRILGPDAYPTQIVLYHPDTVDGWRDLYTGQVHWYVEGRDVGPNGVWHRRSYPMPGNLLGMSPIGLHMTTIGQGMAAARFGYQFFADGALPTGMLRNTEVAIDPKVAAVAKARWMAAMHGSREVAVMGKGWEYQAIQVAPEESQFLETQKYTAAECARLYGPGVPEILGYETGGSMTYANVDQRSLHLLIYSLDPWLTGLERMFTAMLPQPQFVKFNRSALLRMTTDQRYAAYQIASLIGLQTPNEQRALEDLGPVPWGNKPWVAAQQAPPPPGQEAAGARLDQEQRRFDPKEPRIPGGPHGGEWGHGGGHALEHLVKDAGSGDKSKAPDPLKLGGRIDLKPGESFRGSGKVSADAGQDVRVAWVAGGDGKHLRLTAGGDRDPELSDNEAEQALHDTAAEWAAGDDGQTINLDEDGVASLRTALSNAQENGAEAAKREKQIVKSFDDLYARENAKDEGDLSPAGKAESDRLFAEQEKVSWGQEDVDAFWSTTVYGPSGQQLRIGVAADDHDPGHYSTVIVAGKGLSGSSWDELRSDAEVGFNGSILSKAQVAKLLKLLEGPAEARTATAADEQRAGQHDIAEEGHDYWVHGKGLAKWADTDDPWTELHRHLVEVGMPDEEAKRTAAEWFHEVFHFWPGSDVNRVTHGHPPRGEKVGPG